MPEPANIIPLNPGQPKRTPRRGPWRSRARKIVEPHVTTIADAMDSWEVALNARNRSHHTIAEYRRTLIIFSTWLITEGITDDVETITADDVRRFLIHEADREHNKPGAKHAKRTRPATAAKHFRNLRAFFNWVIKQELRSAPSPVHEEDQPHVPEVEKHPLTDDQVIALLATCKPKGKVREFEDVRDEAIIRLMLDCGPRRTGAAGLRYTPDTPDTHDLDLKRYRVRIYLKGGREMWAPIGKKTALALDRYIRMRNRHPDAEEQWLWLGAYGRLTGSGIYQMFKRRGKIIGFPGLHPHQLRRTSVTKYLDNGGNELDAMYNYGWESPAMPRYYTKETAKERARAAHAKISPGDSF